MGADLYLSSLPHCVLNDERKEKITESINSISDKKILAYNEDYLSEELPDVSLLDMRYGSGSEDEALAAVVRQIVLDNTFIILEQQDCPRDVASITFPGMDYRVLITGGPSWGDAPTEAADYFDKVTGLEELWDLLQSFAEEDFKWQ